jgi:hypothetical protein
MESGQIALNWLHAISNQDKQQCLKLSAPDIHVYGPTGVSIGQEHLDIWFTTYKMKIQVNGIYTKGYLVIVDHKIEWPSEGKMIENSGLIEIHNNKVFSYKRVERSQMDLSGFTQFKN